MSVYGGEINCLDIADDVLNDMRKHVGRLHDRLTETDEILHHSHAVNEKILVMKEVINCFIGFSVFTVYSIFRWSNCFFSTKMKLALLIPVFEPKTEKVWFVLYNMKIVKF